MQEEVEMRTVTMAFHASKFSGRVMKNGIAKLLHAMHGKLTVPHGKQSVRKLARQNQGMTNIEINDPDIHAFERIARKYGVDFAVKRAKGDETKYLVFFKARDADALTAAFKEYSAKSIQKETERPSTISQLRKFIDMVRNMKPDPTKNKDRGREL